MCLEFAGYLEKDTDGSRRTGAVSGDPARLTVPTVKEPRPTISISMKNNPKEEKERRAILAGGSGFLGCSLAEETVCPWVGSDRVDAKS